jgi:uncharacterized integral membrane protein
MSKLKWLFLASLVVFSLIVIFQNRAPTEVRLLFSSFELSKAALLLIMLGVGYVLGLATPTLWRFAAKRAQNKKIKESAATDASSSS